MQTIDLSALVMTGSNTDGHASISALYSSGLLQNKTAHIFGPASIYLRGTYGRGDYIYKNTFRPKSSHESPTSETLFVTWSGKEVTSSEIANIVNFEFERAKV